MNTPSFLTGEHVGVEASLPETGEVAVQAVLAAVSDTIRERYADRPELAEQTIDEVLATLGHHADLEEFIYAAQTEGLGDDLRSVVAVLPFRTRFTAILRRAEKARYAKNA